MGLDGRDPRTTLDLDTLRRIASLRRPNWRECVEASGLVYHTHEEGPYWDESVCYAFGRGEIEVLETAARTLHELCLETAGRVVEHGLWGRMGIPEAAIPAIVASWERDDFSLYGRFDLAYDGFQPPKLLEYNADTPTALIEAAVTQWFWLGDTRPGFDQFNSIHERLIAAWKRRGGGCVHFSNLSGHAEDGMTALYLRDTCEQAGLKAKTVAIEEWGWDGLQFVDHENQPIRECFKLYPWEWMWSEPFGQHLARCETKFLEPVWKMLLSNKGLLPLLWEFHPNHPNLLPAYDEPGMLCGNFVRKPRFGREGANVELVEGHVRVESSGGEYGQEGFVYQALAPIPSCDGHFPVCGVWIVDHEAAGMGMREDSRRIMGNLSRFVPHYIEDMPA